MTQKHTYREQEYTVAHQGRQISCLMYLPEGELTGAVILSHGYNGSQRDFALECAALAERGYLACAYDFCGGSVGSRSRGLTTEEMTLFTEKADLLAVFETVSAMAAGKPVFLLGGSQGGCVTAMAAEELEERAAGMVLYFPALMIPDDWRRRYPELTDIPETTELWGMRMGRVFFECIHSFHTFEHIGHFSRPVLIIQGDQDPVVPMSVAEQAARTYPHAELMVLPGEGHGFSPQGMSKVLPRVLDFLASCTQELQ